MNTEISPLGKWVGNGDAVVTVASGGRCTGKTQAAVEWAAHQIVIAKPKQIVEIWVPTLRMGMMTMWQRLVDYNWPCQTARFRKNKKRGELRWKDGRILRLVVRPHVVAIAHDECALHGRRHLFLTTPRSIYAPVWRTATFPTVLIDRERAKELKRIRREMPDVEYRAQYEAEFLADGPCK